MTAAAATIDLLGLAPAPGGPIDDAAAAAVVDALGVPAAELAATPQDPRWHAEGDVWLHTRMALVELVASAVYAGADPVARAVMYAGVLCHDLGKPGTTRLDGILRSAAFLGAGSCAPRPAATGAITSRGHSARGDRLARVALWRAGVPFALREHVCALIRHHQVPMFAIDKPPADSAALVARMAMVTRNDWLAAVADADARGRRCTDPADHRRIIDNVALYRELASEHGALDRPRAFADDHTRAVWLADPAGRAPDVAAFDDTTAEVIVMSGLPATGKTSWLATHRPALPVVSLDELRDVLDIEPEDPQGAVVAAAREAARVHLRAGRPFAWSATTLSRELRTAVIALCRSYRARVHVVYCETSPAELTRRNRERDERDRVPAKAIDRMLARWSIPTPDEAHRVSYVVDGAEAASVGPCWPPSPGV